MTKFAKQSIEKKIVYHQKKIEELSKKLNEIDKKKNEEFLFLFTDEPQTVIFEFEEEQSNEQNKSLNKLLRSN